MTSGPSRCLRNKTISTVVMYTWKKACDRIQRYLILRILHKGGVPERLVIVVEDMNMGASTTARTYEGCSGAFDVKIGLH